MAKHRYAVNQIRKTPTGYRQDHDCYSLYWDKEGKYQGQSQPDVLSENCNVPDIFIPKHKDSKVDNLTIEQMINAFGEDE